MLVSVSVKIEAVFRYDRTKKMLDTFPFKILFVSSCTLLLAFISQPLTERERDADHKWRVNIV